LVRPTRRREREEGKVAGGRFAGVKGEGISENNAKYLSYEKGRGRRRLSGFTKVKDLYSLLGVKWG